MGDLPSGKMAKTTNQRTGAVRLTPAKYLRLAAEGALGQGGVPPFVDGTVDLRNFSLRDQVHTLPAAEISGDLLADGCRQLRTVLCSVHGAASICGSGVREICPWIVPSLGGELAAKN